MTKHNPQPDAAADPEAFAIEAARLAADSRCREVIVLDLRRRSPVTDYYVIATGTSDRQMRAVADELGRCGADRGNRPWRVAGLESASWVVLDFVDVVVHLFSEDLRHYYDLEMLWGDAPRIAWERPEGPA